ncbi:hypothetical protein GW943_01205 [Candidatus Parcubacteria bacterium]|uniref:CARDB domain-containing protein n=1 Tax=Candidatus Kaiserbacteria bacterium CG10_big_fil_rev_8_21_14_0_10_47_16 TaxID=1974608 RepID=A0A2H0UDE6_9BACT|nr:hypothetical protein [Candidatus Parcubacteria bacterium]PIR84444.1 MAG: hypothetical protein COU16_02585 [Candidatus Kaiserbacteria bacterium CG10_big_fil_rev_8_21_14_0_10_47_16]
MTEEGKGRLVTGLTILGFIAVLALCVFAAVKLVQLTPNIFSSLANVTVGTQDESDSTVATTDTTNGPSTVTIIRNPATSTPPTVTPATSTPQQRPPVTPPTTPQQPPVTPQPQPETYTYNYTYLPTSDPNGYTDLVARVYATGYVRNHTFVESPYVDTNDTAAVQISVKNTGTKTSDRFDVDITLPTGDDFSLDNQAGIQPNEEVIITFSFDPRSLSGTRSFDGRVSVSNDVNVSSNSFYGTVQFRN